MHKTRSSRLSWTGVLVATCTLTMLFFLSVIYPSKGDFSYFHSSTAALVGRSAQASFIDSNPGFYVLTVQLSEICNIPYEHLPVLPLQLVPLAAVIIAVLKRMGTPRLLTLGLATAFLTQWTWPAPFTWGSHDLGFILSLTILFLLQIRQNDVSPTSIRIGISLAIVMSLVAVNLVSYKLTYFAVVCLITASVYNWISGRLATRHHGRAAGSRIGMIALVGVVFTLWFNEFIYGTFVPIIGDLQSFSSGTGLHRLIASSSSVIGEFTYHTPLLTTIASTVRLAIVASCLLLALLVTVTHSALSKSEDDVRRLFIAVLISGALVALIYNILGLLDLGLVVLAGFMSYAFLASVLSKRVRMLIVYGSCAVLMLMNTVVIIDTMANDSYVGQKDVSQFSYLEAPTMWYLDYCSDEFVTDGSYVVKYEGFSDVFTSGYLTYGFVSENESSNIQTISVDQFLWILGLESHNQSDGDDAQRVFLINYRLRHFSMDGWQTMGSWLSHRAAIHENVLLNKWYASGDVEIHGQL